MNKKVVSVIIFASLFCCASLALADGGASIPNPLEGVNSFGDLLTKIAEGVGEVVAALGTVMIIVAGILYLTSAGSPERISKAKTALFYAIAGITIGLAARAIVEIIKNIIGAGS